MIETRSQKSHMTTRQHEKSKILGGSTKKQTSKFKKTEEIKETLPASSPLDQSEKATTGAQSINELLLQSFLSSFQSGFKKSVMVSRNAELDQIRKIVQKSQRSRTSSLINVCGAPGTGKTSTILELLEQLKETGACDTSYVNCSISTTVEDVLSLFTTADDLKTDMKKRVVVAPARIYKKSGLQESLYEIHRIRASSERPLLVVLDEANQLGEVSWKRSSRPKSKKESSAARDVLYESVSRSLLEMILIFLTSFDSNLILLCISNSMTFGSDLSNARNNTNTRLTSIMNTIAFTTYTNEQMQAIVERRFESARRNFLEEMRIAENAKDAKSMNAEKLVKDFEPIDEMAKVMLLKKVALFKGDCRQLLDGLRDLFSIQLAEQTKSTKIAKKRRYKSTKELQDDDDLLGCSPPKQRRSAGELKINKLPRSCGSSHRRLRSPCLSPSSSTTAISSLSEASLSCSSSENTTTTPRSRASHQAFTPRQRIASSQQRRRCCCSPPTAALHPSFPEMNCINLMTPITNQRDNNNNIIEEEMASPPIPQSISIRDTHSMLSRRFESSASRYSSLLRSCPLQLQILLFAVFQAVERNDAGRRSNQRADVVAVQKLYNAFCTRHQIEAGFNSMNIIDGLQSLERDGVIKLRSASKSSKTFRSMVNSSAVEILVDSMTIETVLKNLKSVFKDGLVERADKS